MRNLSLLIGFFEEVIPELNGPKNEDTLARVVDKSPDLILETMERNGKIIAVTEFLNLIKSELMENVRVEDLTESLLSRYKQHYDKGQVIKAFNNIAEALKLALYDTTETLSSIPPYISLAASIAILVILESNRRKIILER